MIFKSVRGKQDLAENIWTIMQKNSLTGTGEEYPLPGSTKRDKLVNCISLIGVFVYFEIRGCYVRLSCKAVI